MDLTGLIVGPSPRASAASVAVGIISGLLAVVVRGTGGVAQLTDPVHFIGILACTVIAYRYRGFVPTWIAGVTPLAMVSLPEVHSNSYSTWPWWKEIVIALDGPIWGGFWLAVAGFSIGLVANQSVQEIRSDRSILDSRRL